MYVVDCTDLREAFENTTRALAPHDRLQSLALVWVEGPAPHARQNVFFSSTRRWRFGSQFHQKMTIGLVSGRLRARGRSFMFAYDVSGVFAHIVFTRGSNIKLVGGGNHTVCDLKSSSDFFFHLFMSRKIGWDHTFRHLHWVLSRDAGTLKTVGLVFPIGRIEIFLARLRPRVWRSRKCTCTSWLRDTPLTCICALVISLFKLSGSNLTNPMLGEGPQLTWGARIYNRGAWLCNHPTFLQRVHVYSDFLQPRDERDDLNSIWTVLMTYLMYMYHLINQTVKYKFYTSSV